MSLILRSTWVSTPSLICYRQIFLDIKVTSKEFNEIKRKLILIRKHVSTKPEFLSLMSIIEELLKQEKWKWFGFFSLDIVIISLLNKMFPCHAMQWPVLVAGWSVDLFQDSCFILSFERCTFVCLFIKLSLQSKS